MKINCYVLARHLLSELSMVVDSVQQKEADVNGSLIELAF